MRGVRRLWKCLPIGLVVLGIVASSQTAGCGVFPWYFANAITDPNGNPVTLEQISEIARDPDLSDDEKRQALRDLGIEDEDLIDILLST